jgi:hypothetical protein
MIKACPEEHFMQLAAAYGQALVSIQVRVITSQTYPERQAHAKGVPPLTKELAIDSSPHVMQPGPYKLQIEPKGQRH